MQTRQSPPQSDTGGTASEGDITGTGISKTIWTDLDEDELIAFIVAHKAEAGDGGNFKKTTWTAAATHMEQFTTKGGPKTPNACKSKWGQLRESFNTVSNLKNLSGFSWDDAKGLDIDLKTDDAFKALLKSNGKVGPFRNKGFRHYDAMYPIMPKAIRGKHVFRPSHQTFGTAMNISPSPSPAGPASTAARNVHAIDSSPEDNITLPPPSSPIRPPSASASASNSSKRKYSALGLGIASHSSIGTSASSDKRQRMSGVVVLNSIKDSFDTLNRKLDNPGASSSGVGHARDERRIKAMEKVQKELYLDDARLIALIDLFKASIRASDAYMSITRDNLRRGWVEKQLESLGFPPID